MRLSFLGLVALMTLQPAAQADSPISANCASANRGSLPKAFAAFSSETQRRADPASYAQAMDNMISNGPFKQLVDCRNQLKADPQFSYRLRFLRRDEDQTMSVSRNRTYNGLMARVSIELSFNLKSSPQKVFFTYIHELTHVCQAFHWADLQANFDLIESLPRSFLGGMGVMTEAPSAPECSGYPVHKNPSSEASRSEIKDDYYRHQKLGEVEAFYTMTKAYQYHTRTDPSFCHGNDEDGQLSLYEGYLEMEKMINQGYFAQDIIVKYHEDDSNKEETGAALFDLNSPQQLYPDHVSRPTLNPAMRDLIKGMGMPVIEPVHSLH